MAHCRLTTIFLPFISSLLGLEDPNHLAPPESTWANGELVPNGRQDPLAFMQNHATMFHSAWPNNDYHEGGGWETATASRQDPLPFQFTPVHDSVPNPVFEPLHYTERVEARMVDNIEKREPSVQAQSRSKGMQANQIPEENDCDGLLADLFCNEPGLARTPSPAEQALRNFVSIPLAELEQDLAPECELNQIMAGGLEMYPNDWQEDEHHNGSQCGSDASDEVVWLSNFGHSIQSGSGRQATNGQSGNGGEEGGSDASDEVVWLPNCADSIQSKSGRQETNSQSGNGRGVNRRRRRSKRWPIGKGRRIA